MKRRELIELAVIAPIASALSKVVPDHLEVCRIDLSQSRDSTSVTLVVDGRAVATYHGDARYIAGAKVDGEYRIVEVLTMEVP